MHVATDGPLHEPNSASANTADDAPSRPGMIEQLRGLYDDGRALVDAEIGYQRARISAVGRQVRFMAALGFIGLVLLFCALIALTVGTMIALIPVLGPWAAMFATVTGCVLMAALSFWLAAGRIGKVSSLFTADPNPEPESRVDEARAGA